MNGAYFVLDVIWDDLTPFSSESKPWRPLLLGVPSKLISVARLKLLSTRRAEAFIGTSSSSIPSIMLTRPARLASLYSLIFSSFYSASRAASSSFFSIVLCSSSLRVGRFYRSANCCLFSSTLEMVEIPSQFCCSYCFFFSFSVMIFSSSITSRSWRRVPRSDSVIPRAASSEVRFLSSSTISTLRSAERVEALFRIRFCS